MKVSEIIQQYGEGRRDFRNLDLRGKSLRGQNLSGADFSNCDLRGTNFRGAILKGTVFYQAKAGLQKRWVIILVLISCLTSAFSGFLSIFGAKFISYFFRSDAEDIELIIGIVLISLLILILIAIIHQGLKVTVVVALAIAVAGSGTVAVVGSVAEAGAVAFALAVVVVGGVARAVAVAVALALAVAEAKAGALALALALAFALALAIAVARAVAIAVAIAVAFTLLGGYLGWRSFRGNPKDEWIRQIAIAFAAIGGTSFYEADLMEADFTEATLKSTDFREANLIRTCWQKTKKLDRVIPGKTLLVNPAVRDLMVTGKGEKKSYEQAIFRGANLKGVNLNYANLKFADLSEATLEEADLEYANLTEVNAVETDFTRAKMTGVCLEAWNIESNTKLDEVDCQFVYLLEHPKPQADDRDEQNDRERRPSSGIFQPGEFTKLFQEVLNTVDLIFQNGIDWKAFITAFKKLQIENENVPLQIQSIENKGDGVIVVKVAVPTNTNKEDIHSSFIQKYNLALKSLEAEYKAKLNVKDVEINSYKRENVRMEKIIKLLSNQPINIKTEAKAVTENRIIKTEGGDYRENIFHDNSRYIETGDNSTYYENYNESQKTLAKAAEEIQNLLKQLEQDNPTASETEKIDYINDETSKGFKKRVVAALMNGGETAIEEFLDNSYLNIGKAVVKGWMNPEG